MRRTLIILGTLLVTTLLVLGACAPALTPAPEETPAPTPTPAPAPAPAEFKVISLDVVPPEVTAGETVSITAVVKNIGGSEGTYAVMLSVDGVTAEAKETTLITPGSSAVVTFSLVKDASGTYEIGVGELSSTLVVKEELVAKEVELKYDDGRSDGTMAIGGTGNGRLVQFSPPSTPFTITKVKIFGNLYGTGYENLSFDVQIWDKVLKEIHSASYPHTKFSLSPGWVEIDIPEVVVGDTFYVLVITNSPREGGVTTGYDSSVKNEHSEVTKSYKIDWWISLPKETTNWMIRVLGTPAEEGTPVTSPLASPTQTIEVSAEFQETINSLDSPQKLSQWMLANIQHESYYEREKESGTRYTPTPQETFEARSGNCRVFAIFACYILQYHGYEAEILSIKVESDERMNHVVCVYHSDGLLYVINNGRMQGPYQDYEDIASAHHEGWSSYELHYLWENYQQLKRPDEIVYR